MAKNKQFAAASSTFFVGKTFFTFFFANFHLSFTPKKMKMEIVMRIESNNK